MRAIPQAIQDFRRGFIEENQDLVLASVTEDVIFQDPFGIFEGSNALRRYCKATFRRFREYRWDVLRFAIDGNTFWMQWDVSMTGDVDPIKDKQIKLMGASIIDIRGDKIAHWNDYWESFPEQLAIPQLSPGKKL
jgi:limonene-1,2-epoxide hydrolase